MDAPLIALVAVSASNFAIDKPYSYRVPDSLAERAAPGARVAVPFGRGNRTSEGVILSVSPGEPTRGLKSIETVLDITPLLGEEQLKLALWMSGMFFCTVFEAVRAMLPAGVWLRGGKAPKRDKTVKIVSLAIPPEEARELSAQKKLRAPFQSAVLALLADAGELPASEIMYRTGATRAVFAPLERLGAILTEEREQFRRPAVSIVEPSPLALTAEQTAVFSRLR
ncbi:MAG: hypothetical protein LBN99_01230, partial [Oscillospiraceae bacterium]|nr:hypothetical protein [Oscillospiraceae bacterium]